ncbi:MAG: SGNH/GDSL hydrolase family protein [Enterococcus casseliflavus]
MELDQFRDVDLVIDRANDSFVQKQFVSQGDYKGRTLTVQVTNNGSVGEVPGLTLNLNWHNEASGLTDLTAFSVINKATSVFAIEYPEHMMTPGKVYASIQIIQDGKVTNLKQFELTVQNLAGQPVGIVEKAEFSALVAVLADSNRFRTDIDSLDTIKADKTSLEVERQRINNLIKLPTGATTNDARLEDIAIAADGRIYDSPGDAVRGQVRNLNNFKNDITISIEPKNLLNLNDENFKENQFIVPTTGTLNESTSYDTSGFIPVTPGKKLIITIDFNGIRVKTNMRYIAAYDSSKNIMPTSGSSSDVTDFLITKDVNYVRVSYLTRSDFSNHMISEVEADDNSVPSYEDYFEPYYKLSVKTDSTLSKKNEPADAMAVGDAIALIEGGGSRYKNPSEVKKIDTLSANTPFAIADFPEMLKTGQSISYSAKISDFGADAKIEIGFINPAYATYQSWLEITSDRVKWLLSGSNAILNNLHNLTIKDYIDINFKVTTDTGQLEILIVTNGGSYRFKQVSDSTRFNAIGTLTARATMPTSDVVLSGTCTQFKCDTWLIGDSYFGSGPARIGGKLTEWGYSNDVLIDGLGGLNSAQAYEEFQKLLKYGTPKTLVWYLGMNDNATTVASHFPLVEQLCDQNGIELIFNRIPLVPSRLTENNAVNNYVMASGRRYVDSYSAVGANASGNWYAGHLNSDGVHPDPLGASALTARMIADVPEILA